MEHTLKRVNKGGSGMDSSITPTCSCGWVGHPEFAYNSYQYTNVVAQEKGHLTQVRFNQEGTTTGRFKTCSPGNSTVPKSDTQP